VSTYSNQEVIEYLLDHYQNPRNHGELPDADLVYKGGHPGCSDMVTIYLKIHDGKLERLTFTGEGCTISQAATSILSEHVQGKSISEIESLDYHLIEDEIGADLVKSRPRCATLGLDPQKSALQQQK